MTKTTNKLTKAEKQELILNQVKNLVENTTKKLFDPDNLYPGFSQTHYSHKLESQSELTEMILESSDKEKIIREFAAEINMILIDFEGNTKGVKHIYQFVINAKFAVEAAFWAADYQKEMEPILANPESTIQQVLDVYHKYMTLYPHWADDLVIDSSSIGLNPSRVEDSISFFTEKHWENWTPKSGS